MQPVRVIRDPGLHARIIRRDPLTYRDGADERIDRPAHVRAASGLAWLGDRLAIIQDDASFIALIDASGNAGGSAESKDGGGGPRAGGTVSVHPVPGGIDVLTLPPGAGGLRQFD